MRIHLLGLAHLPTNRNVAWCCGFTQKIVNLAKILRRNGCEITFYGGEGSIVECDEFVQVISEDQRKACYGEYDWRKEPYRCDGNDSAHQEFNRNAIREINARKQPHDFLLCTFGVWQKPIADACTGLMVVEPGVGYGGVFSDHRVFESYAWMHTIYGRLGIQDGNWYDAVIPNFFDVDQYELREKKEDYVLYFGRVTKRKGVDIAIQVTKELGLKLIVAGQLGADHIDLSVSNVYYVGPVSDQRRSELMSHARAVMVPTYYLEPFGGVAVEAMLCGTPAITSDWGAFPETVSHGVTGFRCRTFSEFCDGVERANTIDPVACRTLAEKRFSLEAIAPMYERYFERLNDLWTDGWYARRQTTDERTATGPSCGSACTCRADRQANPIR